MEIKFEKTFFCFRKAKWKWAKWMSAADIVAQICALTTYKYSLLLYKLIRKIPQFIFTSETLVFIDSEI